MASNKRKQLINTALELFYREGYHATGIDRILAESGVAKMTLYKHFKSKDELILAVLENRGQAVLEQLNALRDSAAPREAVLLVFDGLHAWISAADFCGCSFINAAAEFHDRQHPIHRQAATFKAAFAEHLRQSLEQLGVADALPLASQLQFLFEGALSMAHVQGPGDQALQARAAAETLLQARGV
ncbi:TetR/AcrR family transcriptional regulator [Pseudomonas sp. Gutcm_11s]|uniref:TetR/AcrR family transcriptional regulator n=1 Tax=Pseudomonas sp. Gutcm_11s TaxID=3026088 RepID=UPI0023622CBC|nr:TetR/AcrR family transcriptional regulator [Pseudomonas sp. Gutcm_11s]MDD0843903.1 TetR/AcrR family transcriptional regulator [Pseudomonas sp. Gutcm_11s]